MTTDIAWTVLIEAADQAATTWQAVHPAAKVNGPSAEWVAGVVADGQTLAAGRGPWRVRVWSGADADTGGVADWTLVRGSSRPSIANRAVRARPQRIGPVRSSCPCGLAEGVSTSLGRDGSWPAGVGLRQDRDRVVRAGSRSAASVAVVRSWKVAWLMRSVRTSAMIVA